MPRGDGTGPMGMGEMTGRGAGYCNGSNTPGFANPGGFGGRCGVGFGRGRGYRNMFNATGMPGWARYNYSGANGAAADEKSFLSNQVKSLENQLQQVKKRLSNFDEEAE